FHRQGDRALGRGGQDRRRHAAVARSSSDAARRLRAYLRAPVRFAYIRRSERRTTARSLAGTPAIAPRSAAIAFGIRRSTIERPFALRRTTTSRLLVAERV